MPGFAADGMRSNDIRFFDVATNTPPNRPLTSGVEPDATGL